MWVRRCDGSCGQPGQVENTSAQRAMGDDVAHWKALAEAREKDLQAQQELWKETTDAAAELEKSLLAEIEAVGRVVPMRTSISYHLLQRRASAPSPPPPRNRSGVPR